MRDWLLLSSIVLVIITCTALFIIQGIILEEKTIGHWEGIYKSDTCTLETASCTEFYRTGRILKGDKVACPPIRMELRGVDPGAYVEGYVLIHCDSAKLNK